MAKITIKKGIDDSEFQSRMVTTKTGMQKQVFSQRAELETENLRILIDLDIEGPNKARPVGSVWEWDVEGDVVAGRFGPELSRNLTLKPAAAAKLSKVG